MKLKLVLALVLVALTALLPWRFRAQTAHADGLTPNEIVTTVRGMGLNPLARPERRGDYYVVRAADNNGVEMRVVADAKSGDVISIAPVQAFAGVNVMNYGAGPRIIHVPQNYDSRVSMRSEEPARARARIEQPARAPIEPRVEEPRSEAAPDVDAAPYDNAAADPYGRPADANLSPRQPSQPLQSWEQHRRQFNAAPPPQSRAVAREKRYSSSEGPTPIRPTPRFDQRAPQAAADNEAEQAPRRPVRRIDIPRAAAPGE